MLKTTARRLIRLRELHGLTQSGLARRSGLSLSTVNAIESGQLADVRVSTIERLCALLGTSPNFLLGYDDRPTWNVGPKCCLCKMEIPPLHIHTVGECILLIHELGRSAALIATTFGLSLATVEQALRDEYEMRRLRRHFTTPPTRGKPSPGSTQ